MVQPSIEIDSDRFRALLARARFTAVGLAEYMGRHPQTIHRLTQGRGNTTLEFLDDLGDIVGRDEVALLITHKSDRDAYINPITNGVRQ